MRAWPSSPVHRLPARNSDSSACAGPPASPRSPSSEQIRGALCWSSIMAFSSKFRCLRPARACFRSKGMASRRCTRFWNSDTCGAVRYGQRRAPFPSAPQTQPHGEAGKRAPESGLIRGSTRLDLVAAFPLPRSSWQSPPCWVPNPPQQSTNYHWRTGATAPPAAVEAVSNKVDFESNYCRIGRIKCEVDSTPHTRSRCSMILVVRAPRIFGAQSH